MLQKTKSPSIADSIPSASDVVSPAELITSFYGLLRRQYPVILFVAGLVHGAWCHLSVHRAAEASRPKPAWSSIREKFSCSNSNPSSVTFLPTRAWWTVKSKLLNPRMSLSQSSRICISPRILNSLPREDLFGSLIGHLITAYICLDTSLLASELELTPTA